MGRIDYSKFRYCTRFEERYPKNLVCRPVCGQLLRDNESQFVDANSNLSARKETGQQL
jgi:hypothetical protein